MRRKRKSRLAAAEFIGILTVTAVVFIKARAYAGAWRGYDAMGGEFFALALTYYILLAQADDTGLCARLRGALRERTGGLNMSAKRNRRRFARASAGLASERQARLLIPLLLYHFPGCIAIASYAGQSRPERARMGY